MKSYPKSKRNPGERANLITEEQKITAGKFGKDFFDGERLYGYGGYNYHPRFWSQVVKDFAKHYNLTPESSILDVGCAKGFMLFDLYNEIPGIKIKGIDISPYAIKNSKQEVSKFLEVGDAKDLSKFKDKEFDLVISITTIHNLDLDNCKKALKEIQRVGKKAFITLDAYRNEEEKKRMNMWNLTAKTYMHVNEWKKLFIDVGYEGDYYWFFP